MIASSIVLGVTITLLFSILSGIAPARDRLTLPGFYYANHRLNLGAVLNLLLSSPFSVNGILYQTFLGYAVGWPAVLTQVAWCLSYVWLNNYRDKVYSAARFQTMHGVIGGVFGKDAERAAARATVLGFTLQVGWEIVVTVAVLSAGFANSNTFFWIVGLSLALAAGAYTIVGGLRGNARANTLQNAVAAASLGTLFVFLIRWSTTNTGAAAPWDGGGFVRLFTALGIVGVITNIVFSLLWQFVDMSTWESLAAETTDGQPPTRKALDWSAVLVFIFPGAIGTVIGMYLRSIPNLDADNILPRTIQLLGSHPYLVVFVIAGIVCAALSTLDGLLLAVAQAGTFDLGKKSDASDVMTWYREHEREIESGAAPQMPIELARKEQRLFAVGRLVIFGGAIAGSAVCIYLTRHWNVNIFDLVYIVVLAQLALFPVVFACLRGTKNRRAGATSVNVAVGIGVVGVVAGILLHRTDLLPWVPLISLATAELILRFGREQWS